MSIRLLTLLFLHGFLSCYGESITCETAACPPCYRCAMNDFGEAKCLINFDLCCPDGKKPLVCPVDPCKGVLCKSVSNTTCLVDNCNNCAVKFYDEALNEMTLEECNPVNKAAVCAPLKCEESCGVCDLSDGVPKCLPGNCAQSPTQEACDCPKCTKCYINKKGDQKCIPDGSCCQDNSKPLKCKEKPCDSAVCRRFPRAKCLTDICGKCQARFFDDLYDDVTLLCDEKIPLTIGSSPESSSNQTTSVTGHQNGTFASADFFFNSPPNSTRGN